MVFHRVTRIVTTIAFASTVSVSLIQSHADDQQEPKHTVAQVMHDAMKKGQWKKLAAGEATKSEAEKLVGLFEDLHRNKAPHGDPKSWEEKTLTLLEAAQAAAQNEKGAGDRLKKAADCRGCHQSHKD